MPKLDNAKVKYVNGYKVDKEDDNVIYSDDKHIYIDKQDNIPYVSVTTLIHNYTNPFDSAFWSAYKAAEALLKPEIFSSLKPVLLTTKRWDPSLIEKLGLDTIVFEDKRAEILQGYEDEKNKSCERGTKIHAEYENQFYKSEEQDLKKFGLGGKFTCKKGYYKLDLPRGVYPEYLISVKSKDGLLRIAGQIDLLIIDGDDVYIVDWKSNREIKQKSYFDKTTRKYQTMKFPLNNLMDCNFYHYSLQLSLYAYLLKQINPKFKIKSLRIVHTDHNNKVTEYKCEYLKDDVERMLKHYKRSIKIKTELDRDKPIKF